MKPTKSNEVILVERYRPNKVEDCILPFRIKQTFLEYLKKGYIDDDLMLTGPSGLGKTTIALAMMNELDAEYRFINASLHGNIDTLRNEIYNFASKVSMDGNRKYIIFDEAERITPATQDAIRGFIEEFSKTCGFIFTCNSKSKIIPALMSRTALIEFNISKAERPMLMKAFYKRICEILDSENIKYESNAIVNYMADNKNSLDFRNILISISKASKLGKITIETLSTDINGTFEELLAALKSKNFNEMRKWLVDNPEYSHSDIFRRFYDAAHNFIKPHTIPLLVILIGKYQYQSSFVADQEINTAAFLVEVMVDCEFL